MAKKGFTIIEVSLVLAIAGLIMMVVFITVPSVQRGERDTARRENISTLITAIKKYQSNNRGALPTGDGSFSYDNKTATNDNTWKGFYRYYLGDNFVDPSGEPYQLLVSTCSGGIGSACSKGNDLTTMDYEMYINISAGCDGEKAVKAENPRKIAVTYKLEGGGTYCESS